MMKKTNGGGEDGDGSNSRKMISELPGGLLQRIIYFLSQEEAVRTSVLSTSWRYVWCTRPNLDMSETTFKGSKHEFLSVVDKSLQRYCDEGLCLEEFSLSISLLAGEDRHVHLESVSLLDKWIPIILTTMGVAEFRLSIISEKEDSYLRYPCLVYDVIRDLVVDSKKIQFERLHVLALHKVLIKQETIDKILSTCTLLTTMCFEECRGIETITLDKKFHKYLKHFTFTPDKCSTLDNTTVEIDDVPTLETIKILYITVRFRGGHKFNNLKSITLKLLSFGIDQISIDAPNLLYFEYEGRIIPSISCAPNCRRPNIKVFAHGVHDSLAWLIKLSQLLQALRLSEISLKISDFCYSPLVMPLDIPEYINGGNKPVVVKHLGLDISHLFSFPSALNGLLCICRPRNITQTVSTLFLPDKELPRKQITRYLRTILVAQSGNRQIRQDLKAVSVQKLERFQKCEETFVWKWQPIEWTAFLECPQLDSIRFQLKWREACQSSRELRKLARILDS